MMESIERDTDYLVFYRKELGKRAKADNQAKDLLRDVSLLLVEQQEDVEALRSQVKALTKTVERLQSKVAIQHTPLHVRSHNTRKPLPPLEVPTSRFVEISDSEDENSNTDNMGIFDDQVHLLRLC
ncbi:hypothetical protein PINS_up000857 [Pythium insidiosum]|nr:hypothetical protein PINS_up000857 [Pythium insidiosum]